MDVTTLPWQSIHPETLVEIESDPDFDQVLIHTCNHFGCHLSDLRFLDTESDSQYSAYRTAVDNTVTRQPLHPDLGRSAETGSLSGLPVILANQFGYGTVTTTIHHLTSAGYTE